MFLPWGVIDYWAYLAGVIFIILVPGPNSLFVLSSSSQAGLKGGLSAAAAVLLGDSILMVLTFLGMATLISHSPWLFMLLKLLGAGYLAYLGLTILRHCLIQPAMGLISSATLATHQYFKKALLLSLSNPKAFLFLLSYFIQFIEPTYPHPVQPFFILALTLNTVSLCYMLTLITCGSLLIKRLTTYPWLSTLGNLALGSVFILFALKLLQATIN